MAVELDQDLDQGQPLAESKPETSASFRIASVDTLRGLTILLMIFVNDLGHAAPSWMHHIQPPNADGMTLADVVFPAFLFIVGVSIPLALEPWSVGGLAALEPARAHRVAHRGAAVHGLDSAQWRARPHAGWAGLGVAGVYEFDLCLVHGSASEGREANFADHPQDRGLHRSGRASGRLPRQAATGRSVVLGPGRGLGLAPYGMVGNSRLDRLGLSDCRDSLADPGSSPRMAHGRACDLMLLHLAMQHRGGLFTRLDNKAWLGWSTPVFKTLESAIGQLNSYVSLGEATGSLAAISMAGCLLGTILRRDSDVATQRDRLRGP